MNKRHIELTVTFHASYKGDETVPHDTSATEVVTVTLPGNLVE